MSEKKRKAKAFTLIEVAVAMVVLVIASVAALGYQAHAMNQARLAHAEMAATRVSRLVLEDWKSTGGSEYYDPTDLNLGFVATDSFELVDNDGLSESLEYVDEMLPTDSQSVYRNSIDDTEILFYLNYRDVDTDESSHTTLRQIAVTAAWQTGSSPLSFGEDGESEESEEGGLSSTGSRSRYPESRTLTFTTYVRIDSAGG